MSTSLMPMDPALSPQQTARLLPIRADLLPEEITNGRRARRMRTFVVVGVVLAMVALGGWSAGAYHSRSLANQDLAKINAQVATVNGTMHDTKHNQITQIISENQAISAELKTLMADDLRWPTLLDTVRATAAASGITLGQVTASLADSSSSSSTAGSTAGGPAIVATLTLQGSGKDKKTIAGFIDALSKVTGISNPSLSTVSQGSSEAGQTGSIPYSFAANAEITSAAQCGRFTTPCKTGGK